MTTLKIMEIVLWELHLAMFMDLTVGLLASLENVVIWEQDIWPIKEHFGFGFDEILKVGFSLLVTCIYRGKSCHEVSTQNLHHQLKRI